MTRPRLTARRALALTAAALVGFGVADAIGERDELFRLKAEFADASGLRKDFYVKIGGVPVGRVASVKLTPRDTALVEMRLDPGALPIGRDATASIRPASLLGEHYVLIEPGNIKSPAPDGMLLPVARTSTAIEIDQVLAALDESTQAALAIFLSESGNALVGRGKDFGQSLLRLPATLAEATEVINELSRDNGALGRLIRDSDRVVAPLARERRSLARFVATGDGALAAFAGNRSELGQAIDGSADAIVQLRRTLRRLRGTANALTPAAEGLRATAAPLAETLTGIPPFARAVKPALREIRRSAPSLERLGREGAPTVKALRPVASKLIETAEAFDPLSELLERRSNDLLAYIEGYARAMHASDALGHIYHPSNITEPGMEDARRLLRRMLRAPRVKRPARRRQRVPPTPRGTPGLADRPRLPSVTRPVLPGLAGRAPRVDAGSAEPLLDFLLGR